MSGSKRQRRAKRRVKRLAHKQDRHGVGNTPARKRGHSRAVEDWNPLSLMEYNFCGIDRF